MWRRGAAAAAAAAALRPAAFAPLATAAAAATRPLAAAWAPLAPRAAAAAAWPRRLASTAPSPSSAGTSPVTVQSVGATTTLVRGGLGYQPVEPAERSHLAPRPKVFAVVEVASKQFKVTTDDVIVLNKLKGTDVGQTVQLDRVLLAGGQDFTLIGRPYVDADRVRVTATVIEEGKAAKVIAFKYRRRKNSKRTRGHRQEITVLRISDISVAPLEPEPAAGTAA